MCLPQGAEWNGGEQSCGILVGQNLIALVSWDRVSPQVALD